LELERTRAKNGDLWVASAGDWLPRHIFWKCHALCATVRMMYLTVWLLFFSEINPEVVICDQVSAPLPLLRKFCSAKLVFYCHYPDKLLSAEGGVLKKLYRIPLDFVEEYSISFADLVFVNSHFTGEVFRKNFPKLQELSPRILHPSLNIEYFDRRFQEADALINEPKSNTFQFLSINRFERKKNIALALQALKEIIEMMSPEERISMTVRLVIAGGFDNRVEENIQHLQELKSTVMEINLQSYVEFMKSPDEVTKCKLLRESTCLLYTPSFEHFGIVPIEAMYAELPVIAVNNGGPTETVVDEETGFLVESTAENFAEKMRIFMSPGIETKNTMGAAGRRRVIDNFSFASFATKLDRHIKALTNN
jgi:alpha-1,3/alpha-1,6-mannosyltransferase